MLNIDKLTIDHSKVSRSFHLLINDFSISANEFVVIMGGSGSGKSSFLDIIGLVEKPNSQAKIEYQFSQNTHYTIQDLWTRSKKRKKLQREEFGYMFQTPFFFTDITLKKNIEISLLLSGKNRDVPNFIKNSGLFRLQENLTGSEFSSECSGGQLQRFSLIRSSIHKPSLLLLDEPTGNLDWATSRAIFQYANDYSQSEFPNSVLMASHDIYHTCHFADKIYYIDKDKSTLCGSNKLIKTKLGWSENGITRDIPETIEFLQERI